MSSDIQFGIGAEDTGFGALLESAKAQSIEAAEQIKLAFESINDAFSKIQTGLLAFTAILAGGEAFKEMIGSTVAATTESVALGRQLGISATQASQLKVAFGAAFITQDQFSNANNKLTIALKKHESAFTDLGVATRDSSGHLRNALDIQLDVNAALLKFQEGTDRNIEGVKIYGRGWQEASGTLRLTPAVMEAAKAKADALGLTVGEKGAADVLAYRTAMNDVHEVIEALGKVVTTALLPVLTEMGDWFGSVGPQAVGILRTVMAGLGVIFGTLVDAGSALLSGLGGALKAIGAAVLAIFGQDSAPVGAMEFFKNVLRTIEVAFILARVVIEAAVEVLMTVIDTLAGELQRLGSVSQAALNALAGDGKWSEVTAAWSKGTQAIEDKTSEHNTKLLAIAKKGMADVNAALLDDIGHAAVDKPTAAPKAGDTSDTGDENKQRLLAKLAAELEAKKAAWATEQAANGSFLQFSLEQEREFWESKRSVVTAGSTDALAVEHNISKLTVQIKKDEYKETLADLKTAEAQFKSNLEAKLAIAQQLAAKIAAAEGTRSTAAQTAAAAVTSIERELAAQRLAINESYIKAASVLELSKIDAAEREAQLENSLGSTTAAQLLAQEKGFEDQRFQLKVQALQRDLALASQDPDKNPAKIATLNQQIIAAQTQHDAQMDKLRIKGTLEANKEWGAVFTSMRSGFATTISDFLKGTTSIGGAIKGLFQDIGNSILQMVSNLAAQYLETSLMQVLTSKTSGAAIIGTLAAQAAAGAFAATAAIPYVGPELAPAAAALAYSDTMAFQAVAAASGGFDIPANVNPLVQTHAEEMILPPPLANAIRDMVTQGGAGGGHTFNVTTLDGASLVKYLNQNGNSVSQALRRLNSRFM